MSNSKGLVLVTGINGFVGTGVALAFLEAGYSIRGTTRTAAKADEWIKHFPQYKDRFDYALVSDIIDEGAFDEAVKGVDFVAHTASPFHMNIKDNEKDMLIPALKGTTNILSAIKDSATVKHLVITASMSSVMDLSAPNNGVGKTYRDDDWNPATYEEAKVHTNPGFIYSASKKIAEAAAWDFIKAHSPKWSLTTLCPPMIFGAPSQPISSLKSLNTSTADIWNLISGEAKEIGPTHFPIYVDIKDISLAHVRAIEVPEARNSRYTVVAGHYSNEQIASYIRKAFPELASRVPETEPLPPPPHFATDSTKIQKELGIKFATFEETISATVEKLLKLEKELK